MNKALDEFGLDLGNLPDMVGVELRMGQILAERAFSEVSHTQVSPGLFMILALVRNNPGQKQTTLAQIWENDKTKYEVSAQRFRSWSCMEYGFF